MKAAMTRYMILYCNGIEIVLPKAFTPLEFVVGEAFQFDWSEEKIKLAGVLTLIKVAYNCPLFLERTDYTLWLITQDYLKIINRLIHDC